MESKTPWYLMVDGDEGSLLSSLVKRKNHLIGQTSNEREVTLDYLDFYQVGTERSPNSVGNFKYNNGVISFNVVSPMIEEALAKATQSKTLPTLFGKDTKFMERRSARELNNYIVNQFSKGRVYDHGIQTELHSLVGNVGILKIMPDKKMNRFKFCSPMITNVGFDNPYYGKVLDRDEIVERCQYNVHTIMEMFPKKKEQIKMMYEREKKDMIDVYQIWCSNKACCSFTDEMVLEAKKIKLPHPYIFKTRTRPCEGVIGMGLSHRLKGYQVEINRLLRKISKSIDVYSFPYVFAPISSGISKIFNNDSGNIYSYRGTTAPHVVNPPQISDSVVKMLFYTIDQAFKDARQDQNSVGGNPFGSVRSGSGLDKKLNIQRSGHYNTLKDYERLYMEIADKMLRYGKQYNIGEDGFWSKQPDLEETLYKLQKYPMEFSANSPREKAVVAEAIVGSGMYSPEEVVDFLGFPDHSVLFTSKIKRIHASYRLIEESLMNLEYIEPDPLLGYNEQREVALKLYSTLIEEGFDYDDDKLVILESFLGVIKDETDRIKQEEIQRALNNNPPATTEAPLESPKGARQELGDKPSSELQREASKEDASG